MQIFHPDGYFTVEEIKTSYDKLNLCLELMQLIEIDYFIDTWYYCDCTSSFNCL